MSLMVLIFFRNLPKGLGSSPSDFANILRVLAGTFAQFG